MLLGKRLRGGSLVLGPIMLGRRTYGVGRVWPSSAVIPALLGFALFLLVAPFSPAALILDEGFNGFQTGARPGGWTFVNCNADSDACTAESYFGEASPSLALAQSDDAAVSCSFAPAGSEKLTFWARGGYVGCSAQLLVEEFFSSSWHTLTSFWNWPAGALIMGPYSLNASTTQVRISNDISAGNGFMIDDVRVGWETPTPTPTPLSPTPTPLPSLTPIPTASPVPSPTPRTASYLVFSTYLGGFYDDRGLAVDLASSGEIFAAGWTIANDFPTCNPYQASLHYNYDTDAFVAKFASCGSILLYSTYLGGWEVDVANDIRVDSIGRAWVTGVTASSTFPTRYPFQAVKASGQDAFFCRLGATGSYLVNSSFLGGYGDDLGYSLAIDSAGRIYLAGETSSPNFPTLDSVQASLAGGKDLFVSSFAFHNALVFSTFWGGGGADTCAPHTLLAGTGGGWSVAGTTSSTDFPLAGAYQSSLAGGADAFVSVFASATAVAFSSYLGGSANDTALGLASDPAGAIYLAGGTLSGDFPTVNAYQAGRISAAGFLAKFPPEGGALLYSTYFGNYAAAVYAVNVDAAGFPYLVGITRSGFPIKNAYQGYFSDTDKTAFAAKLSSDGSQVCYSTYLGGPKNGALDAALSASGTLVVIGYTDGLWPLLNAYQSTIGDYDSAGLAGLRYAPTPTVGPPTPTPPPSPTANPTRTATPTPTATATASPAYTPSPTPPPPELLLSATPVSGTAPLTVSFAATVTGGSGIQYYRWDYNADGVWDYVSAYASRSAHTYSKAGTYQAICEVEDSLGRVARASVFDIQVFPASAALSVDAYADPDTGLAPLSTTLSGDVTASNPVLFYLWDFEHDGIVDSVSLTTPTAAHIYGEAGACAARLTVIDSAGLMASDTAYIQVIPSFPPPVVTAEASPLSGAIPLPVDFGGAADPAAEIILYEWDFEGDGAYDWSSPTGAACSHTYTVVGTYEASLRATKTNGMRGQDTVTVAASPPASLRAWISTPGDNWTVRGNAVTVRANTAPGYLTQWVQPQFKAETAASWTDLTGAIRPPPYSFSCSWDTTLVPDGAYRIRARAADVSDGIAYSDAVSVTVDNSASDPELDEARDVSGNHAKRQKAASDRTSLLEIADGTSLQVPCGALASETAVILSTLAANPHPAGGVLFAFTAAALETGALGKPALLVIPYPDADGDGVVDGTGIDERSLAILRYNSTAAAWQETPECTVSAEENLVQAGIMAAGDYALGATCLRADRPVVDSGDYNGDGTSEIALFRPGGGVWALRGLSRFSFGSAADVPATGDYDGDGTSDPGVFRPASGLWAARALTRLYFGSSSDVSVPADYDGDGRTDPAVFRAVVPGMPSLWVIRAETRAYFGSPGDRASPGEFNGDGTDEIAVFRPSTGLWAVRSLSRFYFGTAGDEATTGDYSGGGPGAAGIFRSSSGLWSIRGVTRFYLGEVSDFPLPADYDGDGRDGGGIFRPLSGLWSARGLTRAFFGTAGDLPATR